MKALGKIKKQIDQIKDLSNIIKTMKNISVVNITHYEKRVQAVREYATTIEKGFQIFLHKNSLKLLEKLEEQEKNKKSRSLGAILIGSEKGLCGEFNEKLIHFFHENSAPREHVNTIVIGNKIGARLEGYDIQSFEFPASHEEISQFLRELLEIIQQWLDEKKISEVAFYYNQLMPGLRYEPKFKSIFPLNLDWLKSLKEKPWPAHCLPVYEMDGEKLFYELTQEFLFISMYQAFIESLASENAGRLSSMQAAEKNIDERLTNLQKNYQLQRQAEITEELFDIVSGFEVLKSKKNP